MKKFGDFIKDIRITKGLTLREFCRILDLDPSNWSKIERNIMPPPKSKQVLQEISKILKLKERSEEWNTLFDLALISHIPPELIESQSVVEKLPVFFRTIRGEKPTRQELEELIKMLSKE